MNAQDTWTKRRQERFKDALKTLLDRGEGSEAIKLFGTGGTLGVLPTEDNLTAWLTDGIGTDATVQLVSLYAKSPCGFCQQGLDPCADCDRHGHFAYAEICESCLGLGVSRCCFCNGSGLSSIDVVPTGLRFAVCLERARFATAHVKEMLAEIPIEPTKIDSIGTMKKQAHTILRLNGLLGILENEIGDAREVHSWTQYSTERVRQIVLEWIALVKQAEIRICDAFKSMSETAMNMAEDAVEGSDIHKLALQRSEFFGRLNSADALDSTCVDHPTVDRILQELT